MEDYHLSVQACCILRIKPVVNLPQLPTYYSPREAPGNTNQILFTGQTIMMNLSNLQQLSKQAFDKAVQVSQEHGSALTEQAIRASVDQAIGVIQIAAQQVKERNLPVSKVSLGTQVSIGIIQLNMNVDMPTDKDLGDAGTVAVDVLPPNGDSSLPT